MMPIYFYLLVGSVFIPLLFSVIFIDFIKDWKLFSISTILVSALFLAWDALFTSWGVWGFNHAYCVGLYILKMPIEEWLFFFIIPFCSIFIHYALQFAATSLKVRKTATKAIAYSIMLLCIVLIGWHHTKLYTVVNFSLLLITIMIALKRHLILLQKFLPSFLIILIPFVLVNGVLTGMATPEPVVWYNPNEFMGVRFITIPLEDIGYAFSMLFCNLMIFEWLKSKQKSA